VPKGVVAISPDDLTIACIPVYHENLPAAVVLLFNTSTRSLSDADLHAITLAVRVGARGLRDGADTIAGPSAGADTDDAFPADAGAAPQPDVAEIDVEELSHLRRGFSSLQEQKDALTARIERAEEELSRARSEVERSAQTVRSLTASRQALAQERDRLKT